MNRQPTIIRHLLLAAVLLYAATGALAAPRPQIEQLVPPQATPVLPAQSPTTSPAAPNPGVSVLETSLTRLAPVGKTTLREVYDNYAFSLPVPARVDIQAMTLRFSFTNSSALLPENSRLIFSVAGKPVGQVALDPRSPEGTVEVAIPPSLLKTGYVPCSFSVSQHVVRECEDYAAPELWTVLDLDKATVRVEYALRPVPDTLSAVSDFLLDSKNFLGAPLHIVVSGTDAANMVLAARASSAAAVRLEFRPPAFSVSTTLRPDMDNLVIGTSDFVAQVFGQSRQQAASGANIRIVPLEGDGNTPPQRHAAVVLEGTDQAGLERAVNAFCMMVGQLPDVPDLDVREVELPQPDGPHGRGAVRTGREYRFDDLGLKNVTFSGLQEAGQRLRLRLPADTYPSPNSMVELVLHMAYGPGARPDSALRVLLNGEYVAAVPLGNPLGDAYQGYKVAIPSSEFRRGVNTLHFQPVVRAKTVACESGLRPIPVTLFADSRITLPRLPTWVDMPRLDLIFEDGFPFGQRPDLGGVTLYCLDQHPSTLAASLHLVAAIAQKTAFPAMGLEVAVGPPKSFAPLSLAVGPTNFLPAPLAQAMPLSPAPSASSQSRRPMPQDDAPASCETPPYPWLNELLEDRAPPGETPDKLPTRLAHDGPGLGEQALLTALRTPGSHEGTCLVLTAATEEILLAGAVAVAAPAFQNVIKGDTALINVLAPDKSRFMTVASKYYLGNAGSVPPLDRYLNRRPWLLVSAASLALAVLVLIVHRLLRRHIHKREATK